MIKKGSGIMIGFNYYNPTEVVFDLQAEEKVDQLLMKYNAHKVLVHYGMGSVIKTGLLQRVIKRLQAANLEFVLLGGVKPNPVLSKVKEGIALVRQEQCDFILAVGGGSTIDSAKAIAVGALSNKDIWTYFQRENEVEQALPVASILTIAAAGSEMSSSCVITNEDGYYKRSISSPLIIAKFALMNPQLTTTLPAYQTASGCVDILMHTFERYFSKETSFDLTDRIAEGLMVTVIKNALILQRNPLDLKARSEVMWASSLSHNDLTGLGTHGGDWSCHRLEHELGGKYDVAHGAGLAALWGTWARYVLAENVERFAKFAYQVFNVEETDDHLKDAQEGIRRVELFYQMLKMPTSLKQLGITVTNDDILDMANKCSNNNQRTIGSMKSLNRNDMLRIYELANH